MYYSTEECELSGILPNMQHLTFCVTKFLLFYQFDNSFCSQISGQIIFLFLMMRTDNPVSMQDTFDTGDVALINLCNMSHDDLPSWI